MTASIVVVLIIIGLLYNAVVEYEYIVEANSKEEAEENFTDYISCEETKNQNVDAGEEVISVSQISK